MTIFAVMKKFLCLAAVLAFASCGGGGSKKLPSGGAPYEIVVVAEDRDFKAAGLGDTIKAVLGEPVPRINSYEPQFDALHMIPEAFGDVARRVGGIVVVQLDSEKYKRPELAPMRDVFASPQVVVYAVGPDAKTLAQHIHEHGEELRKAFNDLERERWTAAALKAPSVEMQRIVHDKFGFEISLPNGFILGKEADNFLWLRFRYPESDQELSIWSYEGNDLSLAALVDARDRYVGLIPGELEGSHMITVREIVEPAVREIEINDRKWVEMRGLWEVANDIMGGPFVSYSTVIDGRVITIDGAVYSPSPYRPKRNLLRQLESIVYSVVPRSIHN